MSWFELKVETNREASEGAANYLTEQGSPGVNIEDSAYFSIPWGDDVICDEKLTFQEKNNDNNSMTTGKELTSFYSTTHQEQEVQRSMSLGNDFNSVENTPGETVSISGYFPDDEDKIWEVITGMESYLYNLEQLGIDPGNFVISCKRIEEADWAESWKKYYHPVEVSESLVIVPSWIEHTERTGQTRIQMDPGMAFGCGNHPTTLMCLRVLEKCKIKDSIVYDLGCGSGILSAAAARLGAAKVIAVDFDPMSVKAAKENCRLNQVSSRVDVHRGELPTFIDGNKDLPPGDIILANLTAGLIIKVLPFLSGLCTENTIIIFSGIIQEKLQNLLENLQNQGYRVEDANIDQEWVTLRAVRE